MAINSVSDATFAQDVLEADGVVLVDFWATWCGPCKQIAPYLEQIAEEMAGKVSVLKMDVDENPMTPMQFGVRGMPTLALFKDGEFLNTKTGADSKSNIEAWIKSTIAEAADA